MIEEQAVYICLPADAPDDFRDILTAMLAPAPSFNNAEEMIDSMTEDGKKMECKTFKISIELVEHRNMKTQHTNLENEDGSAE